MRHALTDLKLDPLDVVHAGESTYPLQEDIRAVACARLTRDVTPL
jgi:hypothetical protein